MVFAFFYKTLSTGNRKFAVPGLQSHPSGFQVAKAILQLNGICCILPAAPQNRVYGSV